MNNTAIVYTDGGLKSICYVIENIPAPEQTIVEIHDLTTNQAEYSAVCHALLRLQRLEITDFALFADSELMVKQLNGDYRTRNVELKTLQERVRSYLPKGAKYKFIWTPREKNKAGLILEGKHPHLFKLGEIDADTEKRPARKPSAVRVSANSARQCNNPS